MMVEIDTLFQTETAKKNIPFSAVDTYVAYKRDYTPPPPQPGEKRVADCESRCLRKRD